MSNFDDLFYTLVLDQANFLMSLEQNSEIAKHLSLDQKMLLDRVLINATKIRTHLQQPEACLDSQPELLTREEFRREVLTRFPDKHSPKEIDKALDTAVQSGKLKFKE